MKRKPIPESIWHEKPALRAAANTLADHVETYQYGLARQAAENLSWHHCRMVGEYLLSLPYTNACMLADSLKGKQRVKMFRDALK